ncbi:metal-dependent transcriptional regulator [Methermicoccus shengliensis]|uniref:Metal-dependent transcriptional regulator n=1 Tax=Methermicoccus shengliensis TaxID=660064 RepID=A0A832RXS3_9EURY|nr:metal-dependent transcriptional regulator [Methermicoccus shengliensis]KUK04128.1 MAG: Iron dependent repressor [Euryarchaeota archaeon 55_53]KUK29972.1 MAG: Iron dependent repressor [Methanosarcinales archeaon 56_1174]MDI3487974.1 DtxR family transcriptional regulator, Mn-dependent transcriptional regulator [Methanosarcinales archaeon]MDN5295570.1 DtxR family transcriptional regulator, Mn-dependent transcriptional regulator [Methanosarcinales archaeon]HIH70361.1 metal-dependent transcripti
MGHRSLDEYKLQEYLETILYLSRKEGSPVKTSSIATEMGVSQPSVTEMLQRLSSKGLIEYTPYHGVSLTPEGHREANLVRRKHQVLECFLVRVLGYSPADAHEESCLLEHSLSERLLDSLCVMLGHPAICPDGNPIPKCKEHSTELGSAILLSELKVGERGRVVAIAHSGHERSPLGVGSNVEVVARREGVLTLNTDQQRMEMDEWYADRFIVYKL